MRSLPLCELQKTVLNGIVDRWSVQQLFDAVYKVIRLPLICFDPGFSMIAYAFERPFYYPHWEWMAKQGAATEAVILEYNYFDNQERMIREREPILFNEGTTLGYAQYCGAVLNGEELMAYCGIMAEDAAREEVLEATRILIKAVSVILRRESHMDGLDYALIVDRTLSPQQSEYLSKRYAGSYLFCVLTCETHQSSTLQYIKSYLLWKGYSIISCIIGADMLYLLACGQNPAERDPALLKELETLAENYHLMIGVSDSFDEASEIPIHRDQALLTLSAGLTKQEKSRAALFRFEDYYCDLVCQTAIEYYGPELCTAKEIRMLAAEDAARGTDYLRTLEVWLKSGRQNAVAALELGQHKATVANRLERIGDLLGESPKECFPRLQIETDLYRMLNRGAFGRAGEVQKK